MSLDQAIALHEQGDLAGAEACYRKVLAGNAACHEALNGLGLIMHQRGRYELAASFIESALKLHPGQADYRYHLAEVLRRSGRHDEAVSRYRQAICRLSGQADYYFGLGNALAELGERVQSIEAYRTAARLAPDDAEIHNNLGNALADQGRRDSALEHLRKAVALNPGYADAHHNLSLVLDSSGDTGPALEHAQRACRLAPDRAEPLLNYGRLLEASGNSPAAIACYRRAFQTAPDDPRVLSIIADRLRTAGEPGTALEVCHRMIALEPNTARHRVSIARCMTDLHRFAEAEVQINTALELDSDCASALGVLAQCLQVRGKFASATELLHRALALQPTFTEAAYLLTLNGDYHVTKHELDRWTALADEPDLADGKRVHLHFALARVQERRGEYQHAFENYQRANRIKARRYPFDPKRHADYVNNITTMFTEDFFEQRRHYGVDDGRLVFIVGMPRSGSTLVEQILASHPQATAVGEHREIREIVRELPGLLGSEEPVPGCCRELSRDISLELARRYIDSLPDATRNAALVCDKMLGNFLRLGVVALLFPRARVVHCVRDPLDTCVSCYTQNFAHGLRFTADLSHLALFYRSYQSLMAHWREVLPLPILDVHYESLIDHPEEIVRELVEYCGLPWDDGCLQPHRLDREVPTASLWQARQPIYRSSVKRWRQYQTFLAPLIEGLSPHPTEGCTD